MKVELKKDVFNKVLVTIETTEEGMAIVRALYERGTNLRAMKQFDSSQYHYSLGQQIAEVCGI